MTGSVLQHANMYDVHKACCMVLEQATYHFCRASCCASGKVTAGCGGTEQVRLRLVLLQICLFKEMPHVTIPEHYAKSVLFSILLINASMLHGIATPRHSGSLQHDGCLCMAAGRRWPPW